MALNWSKTQNQPRFKKLSELQSTLPGDRKAKEHLKETKGTVKGLFGKDED
jgi:hypothetical protein